MQCRLFDFEKLFILIRVNHEVMIRFYFRIRLKNRIRNEISGVRRKRMREPISERMKPDAFSNAFNVSARSRSLPKDVM